MLFFSSRRRHTRCALVTGVQTCALPISSGLHRALVNDAADAAWISRMPDAVQHHLGDRALALLAFGTRLVIDRLGQTIERTQAIEAGIGRSEERRVGKEWVSTCKSRGSPSH